MESSRRELLNYMAEHKSILKNDQNTYGLRFIFTPKNNIKVVSFVCVSYGQAEQ